MTNTNKTAAFFVSLVALTLVSYLIFSTRNETINLNNPKEVETALSEDKTNKLEKISLAEIESNYKKNLKELIVGFESDLADFGESATSAPITETAKTDATSTQPKFEVLAERVSNLKIKLMELTVPGEFRDLHFNLVKTLADKYDEIVSTKKFNADDLLAALNAVEKDYDWLKK